MSTQLNRVWPHTHNLFEGVRTDKQTVESSLFLLWETHLEQALDYLGKIVARLSDEQDREEVSTLLESIEEMVAGFLVAGDLEAAVAFEVGVVKGK